MNLPEGFGHKNIGSNTLHVYERGAIGIEYLKIIVPPEINDYNRQLKENQIDTLDVHVELDTTIRLNETLADLRGDPLFILNALLAVRDRHQHFSELREFGSGFRAHEVTHTYGTPFRRALSQLDDWSQRASEHELISRTHHGSGPENRYMLRPIVRVIDDRIQR
ncbi:MAG: hypothetical protein ABJA64_01550 [Candidatus Saccharibacteria bacterium]